MVEDHNDEAYKRAKKRVKDLRDFYTHVIIYVVVNIILLVINLIQNPDSLWFYWVTIGWGIGLGFHGLSVLMHGNLLGQDWEDRKVEKYMEKEKKE
jgi:uncharacterized integral membrane protein